MFEKLLHRLNSFQNKPEIKSAKSEVVVPTHPLPSATTAKLMERIKDSRAMLTVRVVGSEALYLSALLEVNQDEGYIVLDELNIKQGHQMLCKIRQLQISTRLEDREIKFRCNLEAVGSHRNISYYKIPFPENLEHQLRRKHLRIQAPKGKYLPVHLHTESQDLVTGELNDLSSGGFSAILSRDGADKVRYGDIIPECLLYIGDKTPIKTELEIRYCEDKRYHSRPRLGGHFLRMDQYSERRLQRYISQTDRLNSKGLLNT